MAGAYELNNRTVHTAIEKDEPTTYRFNLYSSEG
jgi:hypothetical protein